MRYINNRLNRKSKKGITLPELIVSVLFTAVIVSAAVSMWFVGGKIFDDTAEVSRIYSQARSFETMFQNAASVAPSLVFTTTTSSSEGDFFNALPEGKTESEYFRFFYNEKRESFCVSYYTAGNSAPMMIEYDALDDVSDVLVGFTIAGDKVLMEYKLAQQEDGSYFIEGGIVLNYAEAGTYPAMRELDYNLYFHVTHGL